MTTSSEPTLAEALRASLADRRSERTQAENLAVPGEVPHQHASDYDADTCLICFPPPATPAVVSSGRDTTGTTP